MVKKAKDDAEATLTEKLVNELIRQHHRSSVGYLMHGVVHNMNGPLQVLSIQTELLKKIMGEEGDILSDLSALPACSSEGGELLKMLEQKRSTCARKVGQLEKEMERLQELTSLVVSRCGSDESGGPAVTDLNEVVRNEVAFLHADLFFKHKTTKQIELTEPLPSVSGRYLDLCQVLNHILQNAIEALADSEKREITIRTGLDGDGVFLSVQDTGCGIPPAAQDKLFSPFYTTKSSPHPGLGLFLSKKILEPLGARFKVESEPGKTQFTVFFTSHGVEERKPCLQKKK